MLCVIVGFVLVVLCVIGSCVLVLVGDGGCVFFFIVVGGVFGFGIVLVVSVGLVSVMYRVVFSMCVVEVGLLCEWVCLLVIV